MDKSEICQRALHTLGSHEYVTGTPGYEACELYFRSTFMFLLKRHDWSFARKEAELVPYKGGGWELPQDWLQLVELRGLNHWRIYGGVIKAEKGAEADGPVVAVYTSMEFVQRGYVPDNMADFAEVLTLMLAAQIAGCVSHDEGKRQKLLGEAETLLRDAMLRDATQDASNDQHPLQVMLDNSITV